MRFAANHRPALRSFFRLSLRTLLLLVLLLCGLLSVEARRQNRQRSAIAWVRSHGGVALFGWQLDKHGQWTDSHSPYSRWMMKILGPDFFQTIKAVDIYNTDLTDLSPLAGLPDLEELHLNGNRIKNLDVLADLEQLRVLHLAYNRIDDISALERLPDLQTLLLDGNRIRDLRPLANQVNLRTLMATDNRITDVEPLVRLASTQQAGPNGPPGLVYIDLRQNPLGPQQVRRLEQALDDGATLRFDAAAE